MNDLISRQAAIDEVAKLLCHIGPSAPLSVYEKVARINLDKIPSAQPDAEALEMAYAHGYTEAESEYRKILAEQPERKRGEWEIYVTDYFGGEDCRCTVCGQCRCVPYWNYCPNCGSEMQRGEHND